MVPPRDPRGLSAGRRRRDAGSGASTDRGLGAPRRLVLTASDVAARTLDVRGHLDVFPKGAFDPPTGRTRGRAFEIEFETETAPVSARLLRSGGVGSPVVLHDDGALAAWFARRKARAGDVVTLERVAGRRVRLGLAARDEGAQASEKAAAPAPRVIDLFAGGGGMALGFKEEGFACALAVERDPDACATLRRNVTPHVVEGAIEDAAAFPEADVVVGGPPCQGFSNLGSRLSNDPRNQLWRQFLRVVAAVRPRVFVMENVPPLLKSQEFVEIEETARMLGYGVEARVLNAADYGAPQVRKRAIILGVLGRRPSFPAPTHADPAARDLTTLDLPPWRTVRDAIGDLPHAPDGRNLHVGRTPTARSLERYAHVPPGGNRFDLPDRLLPECWRKKTEGGTDLFGRLRWDRPSVTIRTEFYKPEKGRYLHPTAHRPITPREAARLQGFPDDYAFVGSRTAIGVQIGNAVPVPLARALARQVRALLAEDPARRAARR